MVAFSELISRVDKIVADTDYTDLIGDFINQGVLEIAGGMQSTLGEHRTPPLSKLFTIDTIDTDTTLAYIDLPSTYHRDLQFIVNGKGFSVSIPNSFLSFSESYPLMDRTGDVYEALENGGKLYYQGIPSTADTLTLHFYRFPIDMEDDDDTPDGIPEHLQIALLVNFAAWKIFDQIEDGLDDAKINTNHHIELFQHALRTLELSLPNDLRGINFITD